MTTTSNEEKRANLERALRAKGFDAQLLRPSVVTVWDHKQSRNRTYYVIHINGYERKHETLESLVSIAVSHRDKVREAKSVEDSDRKGE